MQKKQTDSRAAPAVDASAHLGLAHLCANRFLSRGTEYEELYSAACMGLVKAANVFDPTRGVCFSTYAVPVIMGEIKRIFREGRAVHISRHLQSLAMQAAKFCDRICMEEGREPSLRELADALGISQTEAAQVLCAMQPTVSLTRQTEEGETELPLSEPSPEPEWNEHLALEQVTSSLAPEDRRLLKLRYEDCLTQSQTGAALNMTQVQVSRREKKLLAYLRAALE